MNQLAKSDQNFEHLRRVYYERLSSDRIAFFNFFYHNNDIFRNVSKEDEEFLKDQTKKYTANLSKIVVGSYAAIVFSNHVIFGSMKKLPHFRPLIFFFKYFFLPVIPYGIGQRILYPELELSFLNIAQKYHFDKNDYNKQKAMDILEKAEKQGQLKALLKANMRRLDWSLIPELRQNLCR